VRELENIVERAMIVSPGGELEVDGILRHTQGRGERTANPPVPVGPRLRTLAEVERDHIRAVCGHCGWKINGRGGAAEILGINPSTLRSRMKKLGVARPAGVYPSPESGGEA
jgi:DNA-binding NtrC family response regulator